MVESGQNQPKSSEAPADRETLLAARLARMRTEVRSASQPPAEYGEELFVVTKNSSGLRWNWRYVAVAGFALGGLAVIISLVVTRGGEDSVASTNEDPTVATATGSPPRGGALLGTPTSEATSPTGTGRSPTPTPPPAAEGAIAPRSIGVAEGWDPLESTCRHASLSIL